ncbi:hypothetical protein IV203_012944 [Nitzschia inconspicua]|uniref:gamma-glutamylcyclotransferase n=1 Tax=Nitzschia inconspicua TaxID=303405 RepID=A0A9K3M479_9STRA|nr:hypothetical protein IV203_012944 [Nitzschia inconspicua]
MLPPPNPIRSLITFLILCLVCHTGGSVASTKRNNQNESPSPSSLTTVQSNAVERPKLVTDSLANNKDIYYFGLGSNMLRSKLEGRAVCGTKIHIKSMEPAYVKNHRLAFNMRGFLPLEPGMGSLEAVVSDNNEESVTTTTTKMTSTPLLAYKEPECHGALVKLSAEDYERVMRSEGVPGSNRGYEEVVVLAYPYRCQKNGLSLLLRSKQQPVQAVALRAREHVRLSHDPAPSRRYMTILQRGAQELGLDPSYQDYLQQHPVAQSWPLTRRIAVLNLVFTSKLSFQYKIRFISKLQNWLLWKVYVPPTANVFARTLFDLATTLILLPGSLPGSIMFLYMKLFNRMSPMMKLMVEGHW